MKTCLMIATLLGLASVSGGNARAGIIYDNIDQPTGAFNGIAGGLKGDSFSTGASTSVLTDLQVLLWRDGPATGSITASLYSDSNTSIGADLVTLGTLNDSAATQNQTVYNFDFSSFTPYLLNTNTRYWIVLDTANGSNLFWCSVRNDDNGVGVNGEYSQLDGNIFPNSNVFGPFQMQVTTSAVPEPSSLVLCGIACMGGLAYHVRRRRSS
jgi:hypothetical protein